MSRQRRKPIRKPRSFSWRSATLLCAALSLGLLIGFLIFKSRDARESFPDEGSTKNAPATYAGSQSCRECHLQEFELFENSHHALAERMIDLTNDLPFFPPAREVQHGSQTSELRTTPKGGFELATLGKTFPLERVIGVKPLRQFLTPTDKGRFQVTELAVDPHRGDWFDIFGDEDRKPGEWGHWTGRGMNWNSMCAVCHNTGLHKNYDAATDSYSTKMVERGVGCEACHGPMGEHVSWQRKNPQQKNDPTFKRFNRDEVFDNCGSCHSRRAELTGRFQPGEKFFDHYALTITDETDIYYPDGQVRDEDFEFASFLGSKMHAAGVRCVDCHEPHSNKTRLNGNALCMTCHGAPIPPAPKIDELTHSFHAPGKPGSNCVDCHMPQTTYMQRHARHDHGFTIPDPLLTKKFGIPNACDRCHADRGTDWAIEAVDKWYGEKMNRFTRNRAEVIAEIRTNQNATSENLLTLLKEEKHPFWLAAEVNLLRRWCAEPRVTSTLLAASENTNVLVRATSARSMEPLASRQIPTVQKTLRKLAEDPSRAVRIEAAWALRENIETNSPAGRDLLAYLAHNADQPSGALQLGSFYFDRNENDKAMDYFRRAVNWDSNSAPFHHALAVSLSLAGKSDEAVERMKAASRLAPENAEYHFKLGLAYAEAGKLREAVFELEETVRYDPDYAQAWYNLGLGYSALNNLQLAVEKIQRAESVNANIPLYPYARATILARQGKIESARDALRRALQIQPTFSDAEILLRSLDEKSR